MSRNRNKLLNAHLFFLKFLTQLIFSKFILLKLYVKRIHGVLNGRMQNYDGLSFGASDVAFSGVDASSTLIPFALNSSLNLSLAR